MNFLKGKELFSNIPTYVHGFHDETMVKKMPYSPLGQTGMVVSKIGIGCYQLGLVESGSEAEAEAVQTVIQAIKSGMNYIDNAPWYGFGSAEVVLGKALQQLPRQSYYVATKVGRYNPEYPKMFDFSYERTIKSVDESLEKLGVDYVDIIQVHDLEFSPSLDIILEQTLPALQEVVAKGKAKFIGITGYPLQPLKEVILRSKVPIDTVLSYSRMNLFDRTLTDYLPFFQERGIGVINAAFLGMGLLTPYDLPEWHPAQRDVRDVCVDAIKLCQDSNVDLPKLANHFALTEGQCAVNIVGFNRQELLAKNLEGVTEILSDTEKKVLQELIEKLFVRNYHWEGVEVAKYWQKNLTLVIFQENILYNSH